MTEGRDFIVDQRGSSAIVIWKNPERSELNMTRRLDLTMRSRFEHGIARDEDKEKDLENGWEVA